MGQQKPGKVHVSGTKKQLEERFVTYSVFSNSSVTRWHKKESYRFKNNCPKHKIKYLEYFITYSR